MAEQKTAHKPARTLPQPLHAAASVLRKVPGAGTVGKVAEGTLDKIGAVSPRGRRVAVYTGAGVLGAAGLVEWPVAAAGAAVAWLTQPRPEKPAQAGTADERGSEGAASASGGEAVKSAAKRTAKTTARSTAAAGGAVRGAARSAARSAAARSAAKNTGTAAPRRTHGAARTTVASARPGTGGTHSRTRTTG
ncbi:hypothetical protein AB0L74_00455 [Streptomyces sp. NPDC052020]|uniref:hypothetical protein n=1 Tax=Streptomyces sp. NPDC052020 TaxID=3155677 RepID=UPI003445509F